MTETSPAILWFRRDLRLADHPALDALCRSGRPVIPVFIFDPVAQGYGAAPRFRMDLSLRSLATDLEALGSRLILRRGPALEVLVTLVAETGAGAVAWTRLYEAQSVQRDTKVKAALKARGLDVRSHPGHVLFEPPSVETGQGGPYRVYTPFWKAVRGRDVAAPLPPPGRIAAPDVWPVSERLEDWRMGADMRRGAEIVQPYLQVGEAAARDRLAGFIAEKVDHYNDTRDLLDQDGTSGLSENLAWGEISPVALWHAGRRAMEEGKAGAETFLKEVVWRDFAYHLAFHTPRLTTGNWREVWDSFPWSEDAGSPEATAWKQGRTGIAAVDAAMREMYVTGRMHNRGRMLVASYLTKHLMTHWKIGLDWFADCLIDWDPASNAMGWQWSAGSGPDATPYFRVFNPETQAEKFDKAGRYRRAWIAEGQARPTETALSYFDAIPKGWGLSPSDSYPAPIVSAADGRARALAAYGARDF